MAALQRLLMKSLRKVTGKHFLGSRECFLGYQVFHFSCTHDVNVPSPRPQLGQVFAAPRNNSRFFTQRKWHSDAANFYYEQDPN